MEEDQIQKISEKALSLPDKVRSIVVNDNVSLNRANKALIYIKNLRSQINDTFDPIIKKANEAHKLAISKKKKIEKPLVEAEDYIKPQIASYMAGLDKKRKEEEKEKKERDEAEKVFGKDLEEPVIVSQTPKLTGISMKKIWKFRIVNKLIIPSEYWMLDLHKIGEDIRKSNGKIVIPGVEAYQKDVVSARSDI